MKTTNEKRVYELTQFGVAHRAVHPRYQLGRVAKLVQPGFVVSDISRSTHKRQISSVNDILLECPANCRALLRSEVVKRCRVESGSCPPSMTIS